ncbi:MAG: hypothetical protein GX446_15470 [Chthonomonadales bacterium]|nr:hypothetical protein [Chthonomonadales bacterium]
MSAYGNVPDEDVKIVRRATGVAAQAVQSLPSGGSSGWVVVAYESVLEAILRDWVENGTDDLDDGDAEDLGQIVRASAEVALLQEPSLQDATFRTVLKGWLGDWVANWGTGE